jgi:protein-S-isoprenylcysteine O-methyltransferase Ste14
LPDSVAVEQVRPQAVDHTQSNVHLKGDRSMQDRDPVRHVMVAVAPAIVLGALGISELDWVLRNLSALTTEPGLLTDALLTRGVLYAAFVFAAAITLVTNSGPRARDGRRAVVAISLTASFLMVAGNLVPAGPTLWSGSPRVTETGVAITVAGAALALAAFVSLGSNFSVIPEARVLATRGVYGFVRHPMYLAELLMIIGVLFDRAQLTIVIGTLIVIGLQVYRVHAEESLLRSALPSTFAEFTERTAYRLIPFLW